MNIKKLLCVVAGGLLLVSCGNKNEYEGFEKSETGLYYKFYVENTGKHVPEKDEIVSMSMSIRTEKDSLVQELRQIPTVMQQPKFKGDIFDALSLMHEGDSAVFIINAKQYYNVYNYGQVPAFVKDENTMLWVAIKVDKVISYQQYQADIENQRQENEQKAIAAYLEANNIKATPLPSGLYYIETKAGKGNFPKQGQDCSVHYTGKLLNGTVFDSSISRGEPFPFPLGAGRVIRGWDEGIALMKKSGKAILVIPSYLAYGERNMGDIPPYSPLVFEVELVDVK
jgi:FKBP-type peptidyl-prolyl cis-trans isomerase